MSWATALFTADAHRDENRRLIVRADEKLTAFLELERKSRPMTVIEVRPHGRGWKVFEAPGVEPVFPEKRQAINYAQNRASFRSGEIRILGSNGIVGRTISLDQLGEDPSRERFRAARVWNNLALQGARIVKASASLKRFPDFTEDFSELHPRDPGEHQ